MSFKKDLKKIVFLVVFSGLALTSCAPQDDQPKIRIVGIDGKKSSHPIITRTPEINAQILASQFANQRNAPSSQGSTRYNFGGTNSSKTNPQTAPGQGLATRNESGINPSEIAQNTFQTIPSPQATPTENVEPVIPGANPILLSAGEASENKPQIVQYDLSEDDSPKSTEKTTASPAKPEEKKPIIAIKSGTKKPEPTAIGNKQKGKYFVQVGSFSNPDNAKKALDSMKKFHRGFIETANGEKTIHRVLLGPFSDKKKAGQIVARIKGEGHEAILVK